MYNCKYCGKECKNANSLSNHERRCSINPSTQLIGFNCSYCGRQCKGEQALHKHERHCKSNPSRIPQANPSNESQEVYCSYCGKLCKNQNSLRNHERLCKKNANREIHHLKGVRRPDLAGRIPWNKGLSKDSSDTIKKQAEAISMRLKSGEIIGCFGLRGTDNYSTKPEVKAKVSKKMLGNHYNNPSKTGRGKKGRYKDFYCSSTYELAFIIYCLDKEIPVKKCSYVYDYEYEGKKHKYYPDFIVNNTIIEIKGFYTEKVKVKTESVKDRPIIVLYKKDLKEVFDYIESTYNKTVDKNIHELYQDKEK